MQIQDIVKQYEDAESTIKDLGNLYLDLHKNTGDDGYLALLIPQTKCASNVCVDSFEINDDCVQFTTYESWARGGYDYQSFSMGFDLLNKGKDGLTELVAVQYEKYTQDRK